MNLAEPATLWFAPGRSAAEPGESEAAMPRAAKRRLFSGFVGEVWG